MTNPQPTPQRVAFFVPGLPRPGGSKRGFYIQKLKRVVLTEDNKRSKDWRASVAHEATFAIAAPFTGPLLVTFTFFMPRPKGHFNSRGLVRPAAPKFPACKPDVTKLIRSTEDALKAIAWLDDSQIVAQIGLKYYADAQQKPGCQITIEPARREWRLGQGDILPETKQNTGEMIR